MHSVQKQYTFEWYCILLREYKSKVKSVYLIFFCFWLNLGNWWRCQIFDTIPYYRLSVLQMQKRIKLGRGPGVGSPNLSGIGNLLLIITYPIVSAVVIDGNSVWTNHSKHFLNGPRKKLPYFIHLFINVFWKFMSFGFCLIFSNHTITRFTIPLLQVI